MSRNLLEYPITLKEVCDVIETAYMRAIDDDGIGGLDGYIFDRVMTVVKREFRDEDYNPPQGN